MTQSQLVRAVAGATGDPVRTIRRLGFHIVPVPRKRPKSDDLVLAVLCPFCGHPVGLTSGPIVAPALANCQHCDVEFDFQPEEITVLHPGRLDVPTLVA